MVKSELIKVITRNVREASPDLEPQDVEKAVEYILTFLKITLASGHRIEIRGFGVFTTRDIAPRQGRNPKTGVAVAVPAKKAVHFKAGNLLRAQANYD